MITSYDTDISDAQLQAIGKVAVNWSLLEFLINRVIADLLSITPKEGRIVVSAMNLRPRLDILRLLAELHDWPEVELESLKKVTERIDKAREQHNLIVHGLWVEDNAGCPYLVKYTGKKGRNRSSGEYVRMKIDDINTIAQEVASALGAFDTWWLARRAASIPL
jgi:hypothetical protein